MEVRLKRMEKGVQRKNELLGQNLNPEPTEPTVKTENPIQNSWFPMENPIQHGWFPMAKWVCLFQWGKTPPNSSKSMGK